MAADHYASAMPEQPVLTGPILVVGVGLLGTSVALACREHGLDVLLHDISSDHVRTASGLGAGRPDDGTPVQCVVIASPPELVGDLVVEALVEHPEAVVTDVGSVKGQVLQRVTGRGAELPTGIDLARYVGGHPMAGSERSGPLAASATLFEGRPWAVVPHAEANESAIAVVEALAVLCGAIPQRLTPEAHDLAVARTSHLPHLMSVLVAGQLADADPGQLALSGQGVRDVTRIAAGDPALWQQIISGNSEAVLGLLDAIQAELSTLQTAVAAGDRARLTEVLARGVEGTRAIPGKHGRPLRPTSVVFVTVPDSPGGLARLFADADEAGVNIEDVRIDHDPGRPVGLVEVEVDLQRGTHLVEALTERGWTAHL